MSQRVRAALSCVEFLQHVVEYGLVVRAQRKEGHGRFHFEIVWGPQDEASAFVFDGCECPRQLNQARAEKRVIQVFFGVIQIAQGVFLRRCARSQPLELREHEPHPVTCFASPFDFRKCGFVRAFLGLQEVVKCHVSCRFGKIAFRRDGELGCPLSKCSPITFSALM